MCQEQSDEGFHRLKFHWYPLVALLYRKISLGLTSDHEVDVLIPLESRFCLNFTGSSHHGAYTVTLSLSRNKMYKDVFEKDIHVEL